MTITRKYLDDMWERIEDFEVKLRDDPEHVGLATLLHGVIDSYYHKLNQFKKQNEQN